MNEETLVCASSSRPSSCDKLPEEVDKSITRFTGAILVGITLSGYVFALAVLYAVTKVNIEAVIKTIGQCQ